MTDLEIFEKLCYYDKRNPHYIDEEDELGNLDINCSCDNCFRGNSKLANYILKLKETTHDKEINK